MIAELVAAGCSGGDWERVETGWDLDMYRKMQAHWVEYGPPVYIAAAGFMGHKAPAGSDNADFIEPHDLGSFLSGFPGAKVIS